MKYVLQNAKVSVQTVCYSLGENQRVRITPCATQIKARKQFILMMLPYSREVICQNSLKNQINE